MNIKELEKQKEELEKAIHLEKEKEELRVVEEKKKKREDFLRKMAEGRERVRLEKLGQTQPVVEPQNKKGKRIYQKNDFMQEWESKCLKRNPSGKATKS